MLDILFSQVNVLALCVCTREAVQSMRDRNVDDGHVFHLSRYHCSDIICASFWPYSLLHSILNGILMILMIP